MKGRIDEEKLKYEFLKLFGYMVTSARGLVDEPKLYGPFRMLDCVSRFITLLDYEGLADDFLKKERAKIDDIKDLLMRDERKFVESLDQVTIDLATALREWRRKERR